MYFLSIFNQGLEMRRNLFDPEDFDRVSSGDSELAELMKQFDRERSEKEEEGEEEARADPEVGGRKRVRKEEGSYWLKWLQLYDITGNDEMVAIAFCKEGATFCLTFIFNLTDRRCSGGAAPRQEIREQRRLPLPVRPQGRPAARLLDLRHLSGIPRSVPGQRQVLLELRG